MFRASCLVMGLLCAAPASAGTAAAFDFTAKVPEAPSLANSVISNGVAAAGTAEFVVYNHGIWTAPRPAAAKSAATPVVATTAALPTPLERPVATDASSCSDAQIPWRSRLSTRTIAARMAYWPLVRDAECRHRLPSGLLDALVLHESRYMPWAVSRVGAGGRHGRHRCAGAPRRRPRRSSRPPRSALPGAPTRRHGYPAARRASCRRTSTSR